MTEQLTGTLCAPSVGLTKLTRGGILSAGGRGPFWPHAPSNKITIWIITNDIMGFLFISFTSGRFPEYSFREMVFTKDRGHTLSCPRLRVCELPSFATYLNAAFYQVDKKYDQQLQDHKAFKKMRLRGFFRYYSLFIGTATSYMNTLNKKSQRYDKRQNANK
jgi:hypothetical protein